MPEPTIEQIVQAARRAFEGGDREAADALMTRVKEMEAKLPEGIVVLPTGKLGIDREALGRRIRAKETLPGWLADLRYGAAQGAMWNTMDEAVGATQAAQGGDDQPIPGLDMTRSQLAREMARGRLDVANPYLRTAGEVGGAILSPVARGLSAGKGLLDLIIRGAVGGGAYGAAGEGSAGQRAADAGVGAALGGGGSAAFALAAPALARVGQGAKTIAAEQLARYLSQNAAYPGSPVAAQQGANAARAALQRAKDVGQENVFNLADAMGDAGQSALRATMSTPGAARSRTVEALVARQRAQSGRVSAYVEKALQTGGRTADDWTRLLGQQITDEVRPRYKALIDNAPSRVRLGMGRVKSTLGNVVANMKEDQLLANQQMAKSILSKLPEDSITISRAHEMKLDLDQMVTDAYKSGNWRGGEVAKQVRDYFDDILEKSVPGYRQLNADYKALRDAQDALRVGEHLRMAKDTAAPSLQEAVKLVGPTGMPWLRKGMGSKISAEIADMPAGADVSKRFGSLQMKEALGDMDTLRPGRVPERSLSMELADRVKGEQRMFETLFRAVGGSRTDVNLASAADLMQNLLRLDHGAAATALRVAHQVFAGAQLGSNAARVEQLTKALMSKGPEARRVLREATAAEQEALKRVANIVVRGGVGVAASEDVTVPVLGYAAGGYSQGAPEEAQQSTDYNRRDR